MVNGGYDHAWSIFDANFEADNTASLEFGGGMFWDSFRAVGSTPADASASHAKSVMSGIENTPDYYKTADTIEELVAQLDMPADVALETIAHYNELCAAGMYAYDYPINIQGNSHGRCLVEGKCLGEYLAGVYEDVKA